MDKDLENMSLKERLWRFGIEVVRVEWENGRYRGVKLVKDGVCIHNTPTLCYDAGLSICEKLEQNDIS